MTNSANGKRVREPILRVIAATEGDAYGDGAVAFARRVAERLRKLYYRVIQTEPEPL